MMFCLAVRSFHPLPNALVLLPDAGWAQKVPKGIQGFVVTEQELLEGISAEKFMSGLIVNRDNSTFEWKVEPDTEVERPPPADVRAVANLAFLS